MERGKMFADPSVRPRSRVLPTAYSGDLNFHLGLDGDPFAGYFASQVVADNFSEPKLMLKPPKPEAFSPPISDLYGGASSYELGALSSDPLADQNASLIPFSFFSDDLPHKRFRPSTMSPTFQLQPTPPPPPPSPQPVWRPNGAQPWREPPNEIGRRRRAKVSERMHVLGGLMPWETKMTIAKLLEEARKYIKFLEAQVTALQTMPAWSVRPWTGAERWRLGGLEMLNRQQLLEVLVNSAAVQTLLYDKGLCVFSEEQGADLRRMFALVPGPSSAAG